jgi:arylformamidase
MIFLSYILDKNTPTYGNRSRFKQIKESDMSQGDIANDTSISTTVHIGTHIDMPYHFYSDGKTVGDFDADFWVFEKPLIVDIKQDELIINKQLINKLDNIKDGDYDILIVKTGICNVRTKKQFWNDNYGFHPDIYNYIARRFTKIRVFGFDTISVSSFQNRIIGREAHKYFLNPKNPILLLEDMDLRNINEKTKLTKIIVSPLRISNCDGLPCTVFASIDD